MSLTKLAYRGAIYGIVIMVMLALDVPGKIKQTVGMQ